MQHLHHYPCQASKAHSEDCKNLSDCPLAVAFTPLHPISEIPFKLTPGHGSPLFLQTAPCLTRFKAKVDIRAPGCLAGHCTPWLPSLFALVIHYSSHFAKRLPAMGPWGHGAMGCSLLPPWSPPQGHRPCSYVLSGLLLTCHENSPLLLLYSSTMFSFSSQLFSPNTFHILKKENTLSGSPRDVSSQALFTAPSSLPRIAAGTHLLNT